MLRAAPPSYRRGGRPEFAAGSAAPVFEPSGGGGNFGRDAVEDAAGSGDSITMGQLKANGPPVPERQRVSEFAYRYDDSDTMMNELDEFYPYVEMTHIAQAPSLFEGSFDGQWTEASSAKRREYMELQLEHMESPMVNVRRTAQGRVLYLLQGCFGEATYPEMQLKWIIENARTLRSVDGIAPLVLALREANRKYNASTDVSEKPVSSSSSSNPPISTVDPYDERSAELMDILAMLYFVIEVSRSDETLGEELMAMSPALPIVLFNIVAGLKDKMPKGYPVKKLLLLLWKTLLACLGGTKDAAKARALSRELAGLRAEEKNFTKATPIDIATFRRDTSVKYPTFAPTTSISTSVPNEKLAEGMKPIPARPNYHSTELPASISRSQGEIHSSHPAPTGTAQPMPGTPAPTPPMSPALGPRAKKQQFQTDPTKPYVFPFSSSSFSSSNPNSLVPFAIAEADRLYHRHAYVSLGLLQMWEMREECMREERGLGSRGLLGFELLPDDEEDAAEMEAMERDLRYEEEERACMAQDDKEGAKIARDKRQAARRLYRVEVIYRNTLPSMQSCVIVLLKLLLATVTGPGAGANLMHAPLPVGQQSPVNENLPQDNQPPPSREEVDVARHREINSKAVSAILLLLLKWFKASHILKFHYFAQLLFDSNCLLLVLKMFGLTDVYQMVKTQNERIDLNFFTYCRTQCYRNAADQRVIPSAPSTLQVVTVEAAAGGTTEIDMITDYSWRNFFSSINFLKILQKMTKHRSHRTWMLSQYKSSQVLKRMLRVNQRMLNLQVLKLIKSQMPWCGRKWRGGNMKVITSIYLNCHPELRDEWLSGSDQDIELEDAMPQEYALRSLITFYNKRHYAAYLVPLASPEPAHKRSDSVSAVTLEDPSLRPGAQGHRASITDPDVFPPRKTDASLPYNPDGMIEFWLHEYEDVLVEVFGDAESDWVISGGSSDGEDGEAEEGEDGAIRPRKVPTAAEGDRAWNALGEIMGDADDISDSESVVSVGELGEEARLEEPEGIEDGVFARQQARRRSGGGGVGENTWEHMSPTTMSLLQKSPAERRRSSSSGSPLRPVVNVGSLSLEADVFDEDDDNLPGPMPIERDTQEGQDRAFAAVDEVEYAYGE